MLHCSFNIQILTVYRTKWFLLITSVTQPLDINLNLQQRNNKHTKFPEFFKQSYLCLRQRRWRVCLRNGKSKNIRGSAFRFLGWQQNVKAEAQTNVSSRAVLGYLYNLQKFASGFCFFLLFQGPFPLIPFLNFLQACKFCLVKVRYAAGKKKTKERKGMVPINWV